MFKSVIKEFGILLLIFIVIALGLIILFYDYNTNKTIPSGVEAYIISSDLANELEIDSNNTSIEKYITTYRVDSADLKTYQKENSYNAGKKNPFMEYSESASSNNTSVDNTNENSTETFFNIVGK